ncbi:MAG: nucleotidyltransferase domain-containing protein [Bacteroidota bacterium]
MVSDKLLESIVNRIVEVYHPEKIILFGSLVDGTYTERSDIDLLLIKDTHEHPVDRAAVIRRSLRDILLPMDILVYTPDEIEKDRQRKYSFIYHVLTSGKVLYARQ